MLTPETMLKAIHDERFVKEITVNCRFNDEGTLITEFHSYCGPVIGCPEQIVQAMEDLINAFKGEERSEVLASTIRNTLQQFLNLLMEQEKIRVDLFRKQIVMRDLGQ